MYGYTKERKKGAANLAVVKLVLIKKKSTATHKNPITADFMYKTNIHVLIN